MTTLAVAAAVTLLGAGTAMAQQQTAAPAAAPTTRPVALGGKVLVLPFEAMGGLAGSYDWVGRAIQQNTVTELGRTQTLQPVAPGQAGTQAAADAQAAVAAGKSAGANFVVFGSFQLVDPDLRINGQVLDVATGKSLVTLKSTGTVRDLFAMEDTIATQAKRALTPQPAVAENQPTPSVQPAQVATAQPVQPVQPPVNGYLNDYNRYTYQPSYYPNGYGYGYGYGYPYGYSYYPTGWYTPWIAPNTGWTSVVQTSHNPIGIGTNGSLVARGMISVPGYHIRSTSVWTK